ncbi:MAG: tetratricopeptide repeat protein [Proteobacteria bacterium]|nr:tetratricopeptide repeat protein [Pseudomonadota bacterium]
MFRVLAGLFSGVFLICCLVAPPPAWARTVPARPKIRLPLQVLTKDGLLRADVLLHETRRILRDGSTDPRLRFFQSIVFLLTEKPQRPRNVRQIMRRVADTRDERVRRLIYFTLGLADLAEKKLHEAVRHFDLAAWGKGASPAARLNLAHLAIATGQPKAAIEVIGAGPIPAFKGYANLARYHLARAHALLWQPKPALANLQAAFFEPGDSPKLRHNLPVPPAYLDKDPYLKFLRDKPEFKALKNSIQNLWVEEKRKYKPRTRSRGR